MAGLIRTLTGAHDEGVRCMAMSSDGSRLLTGAPLDHVVMWDLNTGMIARHLFSGIDDVPLAVAFSPDGTLVAAATERHWVILLDAVSGAEKTRTPLSMTTEGTGVAFVDSASLLSAHGRRYSKYDLSLTEIKQFDGLQNGRIFDMSFPAGGRLVASFHGFADPGEPEIMVWDLDADQLFCSFARTAGKERTAMTLSPDGTRMLMGDIDGHISLAAMDSTPPGAIVREFEPPSGAPAPALRKMVVGVAISQDLGFAVSGDEIGALRIWELSTGKELHRFDTGMTITTVALAPDSTFAVTGGWGQVGVAADGVAKVWDLSGIVV
ncbi:WD40 repeat domain-containing protein [Nocardia sp. GCM10030253]